MSENTLQPFQPVLFFVSKVFILIGMVLVFTFGFMGIGMVLSKYIFEVDIISNPGLLNDYETNPYVLKSLKLIQSFNMIGGFLLPAFLFSKALQQQPDRFIGYVFKPDYRFVLIALGIMLVSTPLISALIEWNEAYTFPASMASMEQKFKATQAEAENLTKAFVATDNIGGLLLNMVVVALLPAICEEFLFRGALMRFLMMCMKNKHLVVVLTAMVFSVMHGEFYGLLPRFMLGVFLGYITWFSGSIWPAVAAHFLNNGLALLAIYFKWDSSGIAVFDSSYSFSMIWVVLSALTTFGLVILLKVKGNQSIQADE